MKRSQFIKKSLLATGAVVSGSAAGAISRPEVNKQAKTSAKLIHAPHHSQFQNHAEQHVLDLIQSTYDQAFRSIEEHGSPGRSPQEQARIGGLLDKLRMTMGVFVPDKGRNGTNTL